MTKEIWINLPVKDINKAVTFFTKMGFTLNERNPVTETHGILFCRGKENGIDVV